MSSTSTSNCVAADAIAQVDGDLLDLPFHLTGELHFLVAEQRADELEQPLGRAQRDRRDGDLQGFDGRRRGGRRGALGAGRFRAGGQRRRNEQRDEEPC